MNTTLLTEMHALLNEGPGDARTNAATTLSVAAIEMSKQVELMKDASKAFATAQSQLPALLKATHEMTTAEVSDLTKLLHRLEVTQTKLKKYVLYASDNAAEAVKMGSALKEPGPVSGAEAEPDIVKTRGLPGFAMVGKKSEPDPDDLDAVVKSYPKGAFKAKPSVIPKPDFDADDWQLYTVSSVAKMSSKKAAVGLNAAAAKALDYLETELPKTSAVGGKSAINKVVLHAYTKFVEPAMHKYSKSGASDTEPRGFIQQKLSDWARTILQDKSITFYDLW
jgi:hypothetical protein